MAEGEGLPPIADFRYDDFILALERLSCIKSPDPEDSITDPDGIVWDRWYRFIGREMVWAAVPNLARDGRIQYGVAGDIGISLKFSYSELLAEIDKIIEER